MGQLLFNHQVSFAGGEFSPSLYARVDISRYLTGLKTARNVNILPHGGVRNRPGTKLVAAAGDSSHQVRLIPFVASATQAYVIELGDYYARFYTNNGQVQLAAAPAWATGTSYAVGTFVSNSGKIYYCLTAHTSGTFSSDLAAGDWTQQTTYQIPTPYAASDLFNVKFAQSADVLYLAHPGYAPQVLTFNSPSNWVLAAYSFLNGPFMPQNTDSTQTLTPSATSNASGTPVVTTEIYISGGQVNIYAGGYTMPGGSPIFTNGQKIVLSGLTGAASIFNGATYSVRIVYLRHAGFYQPYFVCLCPAGTTSSLVSPIPDGTYAQASASIIPFAPITLTASSPVFQTNHVGALFQLVDTIEAQTATYNFTGAGQNLAAIQCGHTWSIITAGGWTGILQIQVSVDGGATWTTTQNLQSDATNDNFSTSGDSGYDQCLIRVYSSGSWSGTASVDLTANSFDWAGTVQIVGVASGTSATATILAQSEAVNTGLANTSATWQWSEGSFSNYRGWPSAVTFFQDRLCWGGTPSEPQTIQFSRTASYNDFGSSSPSQADDAFSVLLPSRTLNAVQNMIVMPQGLVALTTDSEWMITPGNSGLSESSVDVNLQGHRGSSSIAPAVVGIEMLLMQQMGSVCRNLIFQLAVNGFMGDNISIISQHLLSGCTITEMAYQQEPDSIVWLVRNDGALLSCTYMRDQEMNAWTRHDTQGSFESVCTIPNVAMGYNQPWFVVNRTFGGQTVRCIEYMMPRDQGTDPRNQFFLDCGISYNGSPANTFSLPTMFNGQTVAILADGSVVPPQPVSGGQISLPQGQNASIVQIGLPYVSDIETLRIEPPDQKGTAQGRRVAVTEVTARFWNSRGGYFMCMSQDLFTPAATGTEGFDPIIQRDASDDPTQAMPLRTQDYRMTGNGGYDFGAHLFIRQVDPLPMCLVGLFPSALVSEK